MVRACSAPISTHGERHSQRVSSAFITPTCPVARDGYESRANLGDQRVEFGRGSLVHQVLRFGCPVTVGEPRVRVAAHVHEVAGTDWRARVLVPLGALAAGLEHRTRRP